MLRAGMWHLLDSAASAATGTRHKLASGSNRRGQRLSALARSQWVSTQILSQILRSTYAVLLHPVPVRIPMVQYGPAPFTSPALIPAEAC